MPAGYVKCLRAPSYCHTSVCTSVRYIVFLLASNQLLSVITHLWSQGHVYPTGGRKQHEQRKITHCLRLRVPLFLLMDATASNSLSCWILYCLDLQNSVDFSSLAPNHGLNPFLLSADLRLLSYKSQFVVLVVFLAHASSALILINAQIWLKFKTHFASV